ncbi:MAG: NAD(P)H-dependent glycerol-3-phosphate dehydrogenase [Bdellovibrionales bacterium]
MSARKKIAIIGAGQFGTALATVAARAGHDVVLWARNPGIVESIMVTRENDAYLPDVVLPETIRATEHLHDMADAAAVLLVTPAQTTRTVLAAAQSYIDPQVPLVICSKGLEQNTGARLDEIVRDWRPEQNFALLSGPGFYDEIAADGPTAVVMAAPQLATAEDLCRLLCTPNFRLYANDDVAGVALAGALKNPLAIGAGLIAGAPAAHKLGENARAAFITRGIAEITRLGLACGAQLKTFMGLAGIGDVILTCTGARSRNYQYGYALAHGDVLPSFTVEGLPTIAAACTLSAQHGVDMPLMHALYKLCYDKWPLPDVLQELLARPLKSE